MYKCLAFLLLLLSSSDCSASYPGPALVFKQFSENEQYYFKTVPYGARPGDLGKTEVYTNDHKILYTIDRYGDGFLSNDGRYFVSTKLRVGNNNTHTQYLVNIWKDGRSHKSLYIDALIKDTSKLKWGLPSLYSGVSFALWYKRIFVHNDSLYIITIEGNAAIVDVAEGKVVSLKDKKDVVGRFRTSVPNVKVYHNNIDQPTYFGWGIPDLSDGRTFRTAISKSLTLDTLADYKKGCLDVHFSILVDRYGNAQLREWFTYDTKGKEIDQLKERFKKWVAEHNFDASTIPRECEMWLYEDFFYLTFPIK